MLNTLTVEAREQLQNSITLKLLMLRQSLKYAGIFYEGNPSKNTAGLIDFLFGAVEICDNICNDFDELTTAR